MSLHRRILRPACCVLIGALLFAQAAFAMRPCVDQDMSAAAAIAMGQQHDCCEQSVTETNLCVAKCKDSSNLSGRDSLKIPAMPVAAAMPLSIPDADSLASGVAWREPIAIADPPLIIRFCRFLI